MTPDTPAMDEKGEAMDLAWEFVKRKIPEIKTERGLSGVWMTGFRTGWDAASRAQASQEAEVVKPKRHGWPKPGDKMRFLNRNGYDFEREAAANVMTEGQTFTVKSCNVGGFSHSVQFEEIAGSWNGVMFDFANDATAQPSPDADGDAA